MIICSVNVFCEPAFYYKWDSVCVCVCVCVCVHVSKIIYWLFLSCTPPPGQSTSQGLLHTLCVCRDLAKAGKGGGAPSYFRDPAHYFVALSLFNIVPFSFLILFLLFFGQILSLNASELYVHCKKLEKAS